MYILYAFKLKNLTRELKIKKIYYIRVLEKYVTMIILRYLSSLTFVNKAFYVSRFLKMKV